MEFNRIADIDRKGWVVGRREGITPRANFRMYKPSFTAVHLHRAFTNVKILKFWRSVHTVQYRYVSGPWYLLCGHLGSCSSNNRGSSNSRLQSSPGHVDRHLL